MFAANERERENEQKNGQRDEKSTNERDIAERDEMKLCVFCYVYTVCVYLQSESKRLDESKNKESGSFPRERERERV